MARRLGIALGMLAACGGEAAMDRASPSVRHTLIDSGRYDAAVYDAGPFDAGHPDASTWLAAPEFSITLDSSACYGVCPVYWVRFDASGKLSYRGRGHTARPGYFEIELPAEDAEGLRRSLIDAGFLGLQASYLTEADGCTSVSTDAATKTFTLTTPSESKQVKFYEGCETHAAWLLHRLEKQIMHATQVGRFLYPSPDRLLERPSTEEFPTSWVISEQWSSPERVDLGLLRLESASTWKVTTCDGQEISSGLSDHHTYWDRILVSPAEQPGPITWPGVEGPQGVVLLNRMTIDHWISIRVVSLFEEQRQYAYEGERCGSTPP